MERYLALLPVIVLIGCGGCSNKGDDIDKAGEHARDAIEKCLDEGKSLREC